MKTVTYTESNVANILACFDRATAADYADGIDWYARANRAAKRIGRAHGIPLRVVVTVMAALSPNNRWEKNVIDTDRMCAVFAKGRTIRAVRVSTYGANKRKAWRVLREFARAGGRTPHDTFRDILNGPKTMAFYSNIMGMTDWATIDGHARNIAYGSRVPLEHAAVTSIVEYRSLVADYIEAGRRRGINAPTMQAVTWTAWRREHGIA
jgi:hypothetical protein